MFEIIGRVVVYSAIAFGAVAGAVTIWTIVALMISDVPTCAPFSGGC